MKSKLSILTAFTFLLGSSPVWAAADIFWININVSHSYKDPSQDCRSIKPGGEMHFAGQIEDDGRLSRVVMSNFPYKWVYQTIYRSVELTPEEIDGIELFKDKQGRHWLKKFVLSERLVKWVLYHPTYHRGHCPLPQYPQSTAPSVVRYDFETQDINDGFLFSHSNQVTLAGKRADGHPFEATMKLTQREYKYGG